MAKKDLRFPKSYGKDFRHGILITFEGVGIEVGDNKISSLNNQIEINSTKESEIVKYFQKSNSGAKLIGTTKDITKAFTESVSDIKKEMQTILGTAKGSSTLETILLPIPADVKVSYSADWSGQKSSLASYAMREYIKGGGTAEAREKALRIFVTGGLREVTEGIAKDVGFGSEINSLEGIVKSSGVTYNPYMQVMYDSPSFRTFQFAWVLSPKNKEEMKELDEIIWTLKKRMHPKASGVSAEESLTWLFPDYLSINFVIDGNLEKNSALFEIRNCAITNVGIRYETKFRSSDDSPESISITLNLIETVIMSQDDFGTSYNKKNITP